MMIQSLNSPAVIFQHPEYGPRLIFKNGIVNPRDQLGKNGLSFHGWFSSFFYKTIPVEVILENEKSQTKKTIVNINRNSLVKYLGLSITEKYTDETLVAQLNQATCALTPQQKINAGEHGLRHAGEHNQQPLTQSAIGSFISSAISWLYQVTIGSTLGIKIRFLFIGTEKSLLETGEKLARHRYTKALSTVPAYHTHSLTANGVNIAPKSLNSVPETTKDNYIKPQTHDSALHIGGIYPHPYKVDTSTGTTGKATAWVRNTQEVDTVKKSLQLASKIQFGNRKLSYIDAFALGPWATGLTTYELMRGTGGILATGPDKEKILDELLRIEQEDTHQCQICIEKLKLSDELSIQIKGLFEHCLTTLIQNKDMSVNSAFKLHANEIHIENNAEFAQHKSTILASLMQLNESKSQIIIAGYPPFLNDLIKYASQQGHDFLKFNAIGIVGGQAISEAMRDLLIRDGYQKIYSSYGASDLDINLGVETEYEITVRKAIEGNPELAKELYGENKGLPMVFHYDPLNYHVECSKDNDLIYTCTRNDRSSPRIRYNLGDKGRTYASSDVQALLAKYGVFATPKINLPLMFVWGRESTVVYNGANLAFTELERAVTNNDPTNQLLKKAFYTYQDLHGNDCLEIWLELNDDISLTQNQEIEFAQAIFDDLKEMNQDFRYQIEQLDEGNHMLDVRFFNRSKSPISEAGGHRKQVLVFNKDNLPKDFDLSNNRDSNKVELHKSTLRNVHTM